MTVDNDPDAYEILGENPDEPHTRYGRDAAKILVTLLITLFVIFLGVAAVVHEVMKFVFWLLTTTFAQG